MEFLEERPWDLIAFIIMMCLMYALNCNVVDFENAFFVIKSFSPFLAFLFILFLLVLMAGIYIGLAEFLPFLSRSLRGLKKDRLVRFLELFSRSYKTKQGGIAMKKFRLKFLIFQNGRMVEELETEQDFTDDMQLIQALVNFAAHESVVRLEPQVRVLYINGGHTISLPSARDGYGPATNVVIKEIVTL
ncbi:MAG: hypothetical protein V1707_03605 [bacterium]